MTAVVKATLEVSPAPNRISLDRVSKQGSSAALTALLENPLTAAEFQQLQNIDTSAISAAEWGYLAAATAYGASIMATASEATFKALVNLEAGTDYNAYSANLATWSGVAPSANGQSLVAAADYAAMRILLGLVISTNVQAYNANLTTYAGIAPSANVQSLLGAADYAAMRTLLSLGDAALLAEMSAAQFWANTADKVVTTDTAWSAADPVTITFSTTLTLDFSTFINGVVTLTNNTALQTPSNRKKGQSGCIELIQDGTGSRLLDSSNSAFIWAGGVEGVLTTTASARDLLFYQILDDDKVYLSLVKAVA